LLFSDALSQLFDLLNTRGTFLFELLPFLLSGFLNLYNADVNNTKVEILIWSITSPLRWDIKASWADVRIAGK